MELEAEDDSKLLDKMYIKAHEEFVSNHNGTSVLEILFVTLNYPLGVFVNALFILLVTLNTAGGSKTIPLWFRIPFEFFATALPTLLCLTCCSERSEIVLACSMVVVATFSVAVRRSYINLKFKTRRPSFNFADAPAPNCCSQGEKNIVFYVTNYTSSVMFFTVVCILAVDFPIFPRRFAKAETFGFGFMDVGVGSFVFINGLLSFESRHSSSTSSEEDGWLKKRFRFRYVNKALKGVVPLVACGFLRLVSVKWLGYHEHVTEYGLHWNFFFTLAVTKLASSLVYATGFPGRWSWTLSLLVVGLQEVILSLGAGEWILEADGRDRTTMDLLSANREGLVSSLGYLAIHFAGVSWGIVIFRKKSKMIEFLHEAKVLALWTLLMWASSYYSNENLAIPPSRRLCNWTYFNWTVALNLTFLSFCLTCDIVSTYVSMQFLHNLAVQSELSGKGRKSKGILRQSASSFYEDVKIPLSNRAISSRGFGYFLLANILTGMINLSTQTIYVSGCPAVLIIAAYVALLQVFFVCSYQRTVRLKQKPSC